MIVSVIRTYNIHTVLADRTAARSMIGYDDRLLASYCRLSVHVCDAVHCGARGQCRGLKFVPSYTEWSKKAVPQF